jgi:hypothetical protein
MCSAHNSGSRRPTKLSVTDLETRLRESQGQSTFHSQVAWILVRFHSLQDDVNSRDRPLGKLAGEKKQITDSIDNLESLIETSWSLGSAESRADKEHPATALPANGIADLLNSAGPPAQNPSWVDLTKHDDASDDGPVPMDLD